MPVLILRTFGFLTLSSLKKSLLSISSTSRVVEAVVGLVLYWPVLCHFIFSKLSKYILFSADVTVAGQSEHLSCLSDLRCHSPTCHHLCLFERCCITYFRHWPTAILKITTSAQLNHHSHSLLSDFVVVSLQLAACPKCAGWLSPGSSPPTVIHYG